MQNVQYCSTIASLCFFLQGVTSMRAIFYMPGKCRAVFPILCCWALGSDAARLGNHSFWQAGQHGRVSQIFGDLAHPSAVSSSVPRQLRLRGCPSQMYTAALQVGGQDMAVLVDTGSSSLVLLSNDCIGCDSNAGRYRPGKGATDLRMKDNALYSYYPHIGAMGDVYLDTVSVPSDTIPGITSGASMDVRLALLSTYLVGFGSLQSCSGIRDVTGVPGIMGLGLGQGSDNLLLKWGLSSLGTDSLVAALVRQGMPGIFAVQLCNYGGYLWLGGFDRNHVAQGHTPAWFQLVAPIDIEYEGVPYVVWVDSMSLGNTALNLQGTPDRRALVDTGDPTFSLPSDALGTFDQSISVALEAAEGSGHSLSYPAEFPDCVLGLPADKDAVDGLFPIFTLCMRLAEGDTPCLSVPATQAYMQSYPWPDSPKDTLWCYRVLDAGPDSVGTIGVPLMRDFVVIFDVEVGRIGFALQQLSTCPPHDEPPSRPDGHGRVPWWVIMLVVLAGHVLFTAALYAAIKFGILPKLRKWWRHRRASRAFEAPESLLPESLLPSSTPAGDNQDEL